MMQMRKHNALREVTSFGKGGQSLVYKIVTSFVGKERQHKS